MKKEYKYDAFITYRHLTPDKQTAVRLQELLERYRLPKGLKKKGRQKLRLFRDESELVTGSSLSDNIREALEQSRYLIVICSPNTEESKWCIQEITYFQSLHGGANDRILTLLVNQNGEVRFPEVLRFETVTQTDDNGVASKTTRETEPLAANISAPSLKASLKKLKKEYLRIAAPLLGCGYDDLYNREQRRKNKRILTAALTSSAVLALIAAISISSLVTISGQKAQIEEDTKNLKISNSNYLIKESSVLQDGGKHYEALMTVLKALPGDEDDFPLTNSAVERLSELTGAYQKDYFVCDKLLTHNAPVKEMMMMDNGNRIVTVDELGMYLWDTGTGECIREFSTDDYEAVLHDQNHIKDMNFDVHQYDVTQGSDEGQVFVLKDTVQKTSANQEEPYSDNVLYVKYREKDKEALYRIDPEDGSVMWSYPLSTVTNFLPTCSTDYLFFLDNGFTVLNASDGSVAVSLSISDPAYEACLSGVYHRQAEIVDDKLMFVVQKNLDYYLRVLVKKNGSYEMAYSTKMKNSQLVVNPAFCYLDGTAYFSGSCHQSNDAPLVPFIEAYDIDTGNMKWYRESVPLEESDTYLGVLPNGGKKGTPPVVFSFIGNRMMLCDAETGKLTDELYLPNKVVGMYYSDDGHICIFDKAGRELLLYPEERDGASKKYTAQLNDFQSETASAKYMNGVYASLSEGSDTVGVYHTISDPDMKQLLMFGEKESDPGLEGFVLSPDRNRTAVTLTDSPEIHIYTFDREDSDSNGNPDIKVTEKSIVVPDGYSQDIVCEFVGNDLLLVQKALLYDLNTGKIVRALIGDESGFSVSVSESDGSVLIVNKKNNLVYYHEKEDPEIRIAASETDEMKFYPIEAYASPDHKNIVAYMKTVNKNPGENEEKESAAYYLYRGDEDFIKLTDGVIGKGSWKTCLWDDNLNRIYALWNDRLLAFDSQTGETVFEGSYENHISDILMINGELCLVDKVGNLVKVELTDQEIVAKAEIPLRIDLYNIAADHVRFDSVSESSGVVNYRGAGWIIDTEAFELISAVDGYAGIDPENKTIYIREYNRIYSAPLLSAEDMIKRAKDILGPR